MALILAAGNSMGFLAGLTSPKKITSQPMYPGIGAPSEVGSTGLPGDIGFDPLGLANFGALSPHTYMRRLYS